MWMINKKMVIIYFLYSIKPIIMIKSCGNMLTFSISKHPIKAI